jgi:hypothetical protein
MWSSRPESRSFASRLRSASAARRPTAERRSVQPGVAWAHSGLPGPMRMVQRHIGYVEFLSTSLIATSARVFWNVHDERWFLDALHAKLAKKVQQFHVSASLIIWLCICRWRRLRSRSSWKTFVLKRCGQARGCPASLRCISSTSAR